MRATPVSRMTSISSFQPLSSCRPTAPILPKAWQLKHCWISTSLPLPRACGSRVPAWLLGQFAPLDHALLHGEVEGQVLAVLHGDIVAPKRTGLESDRSRGHRVGPGGEIVG